MWLGGSLIFAISLIAAICGVTAVYLIYRVNRWNGYLLLVYTITLYQLVYDLSYFLLPGFENSIIYDIYSALNIIGGTAVTLWINVVSCVLLYTVYRLKSFDVKYYYHYINVTIFLLSASLAIGTIYWYHTYPGNFHLDWVYFWVRVGSIIANVIVYLTVAIKLQNPRAWLRRMWRNIWLLLCPNLLRTTTQSRAASSSYCCLPPGKLQRKTMKATNALLLLLITRLKYYPLVQIITRAAATWWDVRYGFSPDAWSGTYNTQKSVSQLFYDITNPFAGIGFFLVMLYVQPSVYKEFYKLLAESPCFPSVLLQWLVEPDTALAKKAPSSQKSAKKSKPASTNGAAAKKITMSDPSSHTNRQDSDTLHASAESVPTTSRPPATSLRLDSKASSSEASAFTHKGSDYEIQRDSKGLIIAVHDVQASPSSLGTNNHRKHQKYTASSRTKLEHDSTTTVALLPQDHLSTDINSSPISTVYAPYHPPPTAALPPNNRTNSNSHPSRSMSGTSSSAISATSQQHARDKNLSSSTKSTSSASKVSLLFNLTGASQGAHRSGGSMHSVHQLQVALQLAAPPAWSTDTPQGITDYLLAEDDDEDDEENEETVGRDQGRSANPVDRYHRDVPASTSTSATALSGSRIPTLHRPIQSVGSARSVTGSSVRTPWVSTGSDEVDRGSVASSTRSTTGVLSISHNPNDELNFCEEAAEELQGQPQPHQQTRDLVDIEAGNSVDASEELDEAEEVDVDLDEDIVWEEIRRRIDGLRSAYQQIVHQQHHQQQQQQSQSFSRS
jgi:hypothetical protein